MKIRLGLLLLIFSLLPVLLYGQTGSGSIEIPSVGEPPSLITSMAILAAMALLPFAVMMLTSFLKIVVVLSLMRNALGVQQSPPNQAINGIAILMTIYVMFPTANAMYSSVKDHLDTSTGSALLSTTTASQVLQIIDRSKEPLRQFLMRNTMMKNQQYFYQLAYKNFPKDYQTDLSVNDFIVLLPSYITTQLKSAFEIGVLIYLPFFVIDIVTSNILLAMGMMMLSPLTISLPLKLLLIVMIDGWTLVIQGLVLTYR